MEASRRPKGSLIVLLRQRPQQGREEKELWTVLYHPDPALKDGEGSDGREVTAEEGGQEAGPAPGAMGIIPFVQRG